MLGRMHSQKGRRAPSARGRWILALLLCFWPAGCQDTESQTEATSKELASEGPILVDVRWKLGLGGKPLRRSVWVSGDDEIAGARWQEFELEPEADPGAADWYARCTSYRDRCTSLSEAAFDRLVEASHGELPSDEFTRTYGRKDHLVVPSPDGSRAVICHWRDGKRGVIELPSGRVAGWPQDLPWGSGHKYAAEVSWSGDGTSLAFVMADERRGSRPTQRIVVIDVANGVVLHNLPVERWVEELAWSPDGRKLAALVADHRLGTGPIETLFAKFGHGRPYEDLYVQVFDLATGQTTEGLLAKDLPESSAHIHWDPAAVTSRTGWEQP